MEPDRRVYLMSLVSVVCLFEGVLSENVCDSKWKIYYDNCYLFSDLLDTRKESWDKAKSECHNKSAYLASFEDESTWEWMARQMTSLQLSDELWIGLYKANNVFAWDDDKTNSSNFFWKKPEQTETLGPNTCVYATRSGWMESLCNMKYHYICYKPVSRFASMRDVLVITLSIVGSVCGLSLLVWLAYYFIPEAGIKHEELEKNIKKADKENKDVTIQVDEPHEEAFDNEAYEHGTGSTNM